MTFDEWWDANDMDSDPDANYTVSEIVWRAAKEDGE